MRNGESRAPLRVYALKSSEEFAQKVVDEINRIRNSSDLEEVVLGKLVDTYYPDGERKPTYEESIAGIDGYVIQQVQDRRKKGRDLHSNLWALGLALESLQGSGATHRTAVVPYLPYGRQERRRGREPKSSKFLANFLEKTAKATGMLTMDVHDDASEGFFDDIRYNNLRASKLFFEYINQQGLRKGTILTFASPDTGGVARANFYAKGHATPLVIGRKTKNYSTHRIEDLELTGMVKDRLIVCIEDMVSSGTTISKVVNVSQELGAKEVYVIATHLILNDNNNGKTAKDTLDELYDNGNGLLKGIIGTDTIRHDPELIASMPYVKIISAAPLFADAIHRLNTNQSVSELYRDEELTSK